MAHKAVQKQFNEFITQVYGGKGLTKHQREEMRKAFFSGAFIMLNMTRDLSEHPEDIAVSKLEIYNEELITEIGKWCEDG